MEWNPSLQVRKQNSPLVSVNPLSDDGLITERSHQSGHLEGRGCIQSNTCSTQTSIHPQTQSTNQESQEQTRESAIVECPRETKEMTSKGKSHQCESSSQVTKSSKTSDQASTSNAPGCVPSWKWRAKDSSEKLWLPTEIDCAGLPSNWLNGSFSPTESSSWFSIKEWKAQKIANLQKTSCQSSMFSIAESMEGENTRVPKQRTNKLRKSKKPVANRSLKIRLDLKPEDRARVLQWFGSVRVTYNWALSCINENPKAHNCTSLPSLRKRFINKCNIPKSKQFLLDTPKSLRDSALDDLTQGFRSNFDKKKKDPSHQFQMKFRSRKDDQSITLSSLHDVKAWDSQNREMMMYPSIIKNKIKFHTRKKKNVPDEIVHDCKLTKDKLGRIYLIIVYCHEACESQTGCKNNEWCSIDPGVRTMLTVYSPTKGVCYKIGDNDISRIYRLCKHLDGLISKQDSCKNKRDKKRYKKPIIRLRMKIRNLVTEVHCKAVFFLVNRFDNIIIPSFNVSEMVKRGKRKIRSKTARQMICWRHFGFRQRLIDTAKRYNVNVFVRSEHYSSKTCTHCQNVKYDLGGAKKYKCSVCRLIADRDVCGARNIFMMNTASV